MKTNEIIDWIRDHCEGGDYLSKNVLRAHFRKAHKEVLTDFTEFVQKLSGHSCYCEWAYDSSKDTEFFLVARFNLDDRKSMRDLMAKLGVGCPREPWIKYGVATDSGEAKTNMTYRVEAPSFNGHNVVYHFNYERPGLPSPKCKVVAKIEHDVVCDL